MVKIKLPNLRWRLDSQDHEVIKKGKGSYDAMRSYDHKIVKKYLYEDNDTKGFVNHLAYDHNFKEDVVVDVSDLMIRC